jgi:CBS domain-containing protein
MQIREIMTVNPRCVTIDSTARDAAELMKREHVGIIPVVRSDGDKELVGVITDRDIAVRCVADGIEPSKCLVSEVMSGDSLATCNESDDIDDVVQAMQNEKVRRIPIVDDRKRLVGIVSQADVLRKGADVTAVHHAVSHISEPGGKHTS